MPPSWPIHCQIIIHPPSWRQENQGEANLSLSGSPDWVFKGQKGASSHQKGAQTISKPFSVVSGSTISSSPPTSVKSTTLPASSSSSSSSSTSPNLSTSFPSWRGPRPSLFPRPAPSPTYLSYSVLSRRSTERIHCSRLTLSKQTPANAQYIQQELHCTVLHGSTERIRARTVFGMTDWSSHTWAQYLVNEYSAAI